MASIRKEILTGASPEEVWDAIEDIGAIHTRLAPGFVVDTKLEAGARIVTFGNGMVVRETIITIDDEAKRLVWSIVGTTLTHHNGSLQVFGSAGSETRVVWTTDLLPDEAAARVSSMMEQGMAAMKKKLDGAVK